LVIVVVVIQRWEVDRRKKERKKEGSDAGKAK
jgi:hypothetical protein